MTGPPKSQEELKKEQQQELIRQQVNTLVGFNDHRNKKCVISKISLMRALKIISNVQVEQEHEEQMRQLKQRKKKQATPPPPPKTITVMAGKLLIVFGLIEKKYLSIV